MKMMQPLPAGRKPTGPQEINRAMAPAMIIHTLYNDLTNEGCSNDADPGNYGVYGGTPFTLNPFRIRAHGRGVEFHPDGAIYGSDYVKFSSSRLDEDYTFYSDAVVRNTNGPTNGRFWHWGQGSDAARVSTTATTLLHSYIDATPLAQHDVSLSYKNPITEYDRLQSIARKRGNVIDIWCRVNGGVIQRSGTATGGSGGLRPSSEISPSGYNGHEELYHSWVESRALSDAEMESRLLDPYAFLQPAGTAARLMITTPPPAGDGGYAIPDPKWEEPALLQAGVKPTGPVVIDWDHPLADGLVSALGFAPYRSICERRFTNAVILPANSADTPAMDKGAGYYFDGSDYLTVTKTEALHDGDFSVFSVFQPASVTGFQFILGGDNPSSGERDFHFKLNAATMQWVVWVGGTTVVVSGTETIAVDSTHTASASYDSSYSSNNARLFTNGILDGVGSASGGMDSDEPNVGLGCTFLTKSSFFDGSNLTGYINTLFTWDRALSDAEHESLARDPYQFLIPA